MKNLIKRIADNQYFNTPSQEFIEINEKIIIFKNQKDSNIEIRSISNWEYNKKNSLYLYTLKFSYYFLSIAYRLANKS
jgi:hypothetical protein